MDSQKAANWANIVGVFIAAIVLGFVAWDHAPTTGTAGFGLGAVVKGWLPPAIIALIVFVSSVLQVIASRTRSGQPKVKETSREIPSIEILSPFDNDEVGFHEVVRGRVFPPDSHLQVLVFAGDQKWYPQPPVNVKGSTWSVKCQFGNLDTSSGGLYKIAAVSGDDLDQQMWYSDLPTTGVRSNIIRVKRHDITIEYTHSALSKKVENSDELQKRFEGKRQQVSSLEQQLETLGADLLAQREQVTKATGDSREWERKYHTETSQLGRELDSLKTSYEISRREVAEVKAEANAQTNTYELTFKGMAEELKAAQSWKDQYDEEHNAALRLKTLNEQYEKQISNLKSDAEEARKEKLAAASNLDGVETDRNNYRTWFNELAWLSPAIKEQKRDISNHVQVLAARPCLLNLKKRVVIIDLVIRNDSFFDISIKGDAVTGRLSTEKKGLLHDPAKAFFDLTHHPIENLKPTKEATVALIQPLFQPLLKTEAEDIEDSIADDGGCFWLGNLNIPISVQNAEPLHIDSKPLRINSDVEHVYFREFGALTFDGEVITPRELLRDVEALPFPERARIYREISKAYGESRWRLNEAEEKKDPEDLAQESINRNTNNA